MSARVIGLEKMRGGDYAILVDGVNWGTAAARNRGSKGTVYELRDAHRRPVKDHEGDRAHSVEVPGDTALRRRARAYGESEPAPFEQRCALRVSALIDKGAWKSPEELNAHRAAVARRHAEERAAADAAVAAKHRAKAIETLGALNAYRGLDASTFAESDIEAVVAAIKWGQWQQ